LGVPVNVIAGTPQFVEIVIAGLQFKAGANTTNVIDQARSAVLSAVNAVAPNEILRVGNLFAALVGVELLIVPDTAITTPAGDLVPNPGGVIRTTKDRISINE
jgi:hypothetical protein